MHFDVGIVGAGPAGCAAALTLARAGRSVIVLEKKRFPRHKVCGGCLSGWAVDQLQALLGPGALLPGAPGQQISFYIGRHRIRTSSAGRTRIVLRSELDAMLAEAARNAGAELHFGQSAAVQSGNARFQLSTADQAISCEWILLACGLGGQACKLGFGHRPFGPAMAGQQWLLPAQDVRLTAGSVEMHWFRGGYVGLAAPSHAVCIVALAIQTHGCVRGDPLQSLCRMNLPSSLWERIAAVSGEPARGAAGFPFMPKRLTQANAMLVGDAAGYAEPFSGAGIALALYSGVSAAKALISAPDPARYYARAMRTQRNAMWRTRLLGVVLNSRITRGLAAWNLPAVDALAGGLVHGVHVGSAT